MAKTIETTDIEDVTKGMTKTESAAVEELARRVKKRTRAPYLKMDFDDDARVLSIQFDHENEVAAHALAMVQMGTCDERVFKGLLDQVSALGAQGKTISENATNFALGIMAAVEPRDEMEAMLAAQMAATHQAAMMMARRLNHVQTIPQQDAAERAFNKLARTYTVQMDALKRYRAKAQQTVRVERVTVNDGGQAIVGSVSHEGGGREQK